MTTSPRDGPRAASPRFGIRLTRLAVAHPLLTLVIVAGVAAAAIGVTYSTPSTVSTSVAVVPVQFVAGDDAGPSALSDYVSTYSISTNRTYISATVNGVPESALTIDSFFKLANVDDEAHAVSVSTTQVTNDYVGAYTVQLYDAGGALQATVDLTDPSPTATFTIPAGETYGAKLTLTLLSGAGADNVALTNSLTLTV